MDVELQVLPPTVLDVVTEPEGAELWIDGVLSTEKRLEILPRKKVTVEVKLEGYKPQKDSFYGESGETTQKIYRLHKIQ